MTCSIGVRHAGQSFFVAMIVAAQRAQHCTCLHGRKSWSLSSSMQTVQRAAPMVDSGTAARAWKLEALSGTMVGVGVGAGEGTAEGEEADDGVAAA